MTAGFQCWTDDWGDIHVADGVVMQPKEDVLIHVGGGWGFTVSNQELPGVAFHQVRTGAGVTFLGGSGRNLVASGLSPSYSGADCPAGFYVPAEAATYRRKGFVLVVTGASAATISDGTNTIAELSTGGTAPIGSYASTTYGAATYNGTTAFTLTLAAESATPAAAPKALSAVTAGTGPAGEWTATGAASYELDADTDWTLVIDPDGSAEILDGATAIATRATGPAWNPSGRYDATAAGKTAHNAGNPWTAILRLIPAAPMAGTVYLEIVETSGVVTAVNGPFYGTLPASSGSSYFLPLAEFDGTGGSEQYLTGPIQWPPPGGGTATADPTTRNMIILGL